jgi:hypothetical protein
MNDQKHAPPPPVDKGNISETGGIAVCTIPTASGGVVLGHTVTSASSWDWKPARRRRQHRHCWLLDRHLLAPLQGRQPSR